MIGFGRATIGAITLLLGMGVTSQASLAQSTPEKDALSQQLIELMEFETVVVQATDVMTQQVVAAVTQSRPDIPQEALDIIVEVVREEGQILLTGTMSELGPLLGKYYTEEEIQGLIDFYETPLGQKAIRIMPQVMNEIPAVMLPHMEAFQASFPVALKKRLAEAGYE